VAKYKIPKLESSTYRSWTFVLVMGGLLTLVAIIDRGGLDASVADGSTGCQLEVQATTLNIRTGPSTGAESVGTLRQGETVDGTAVVTDGFRQLEGDQWVDNRYVTPLPGSNCS
jgi:hypothetical protein